MEKRSVNLWLAALIGLFCCYYLWSFFVSSRYQALCNMTYWFATPAQVESCKEIKSELDNR
ncbi:hypothetical protein [Methylocystis heyeri]|jgi:hypothetical protein|uniref:Uncharacterized protein n=1 Tax=Methylocystis heyeri TaxID=391905 RepID=A0A6B8KGN0_9HYPH|nr:hypothetical protein [Methylocystis heyeri]QGM45633.1 hypothetical protein H2LOC_007920 [Methylocystis heyeri]